MEIKEKPPIYAAALQDPWFHVCLTECVNCKELVQQVDRLYGTRLMTNKAPIEKMIDEATGKTREDMKRLIEFVYDNVYTRVPHPVNEDGDAHKLP